MTHGLIKNRPGAGCESCLTACLCLAFLAVVTGLLAVSSAAAADSSLQQDWPQWRGPLGTGAAPQSDPPTTWSESSNVRWKVKIPGSGSATPIIWGNFVFVQTAIPKGEEPAAVPFDVEKTANGPPPRRPFPGPDGGPPPGGGGPGRRPGGPGGGGMSVKPTTAYRFMLLCLDRATGKTLWEKVAREEFPHEGHHPTGTFANNSPITDGKHVYAYFGSRGLHCYDMQGDLKWEKDFGKMQTVASFGEGSSPALLGNTIVINWDGENDAFIVALNAETGEERWRQKRDERTGWATPLIVQVEGKPQVITAASKRIRSYELASGKLLWECGGLTSNVIPSPVADDQKVYAMSGFRGNAVLAVRLGGSGDLTDSESIVWKGTKNTPYVPSPLLYGERLYFFSVNTNVFSCLDAKTGKAVFETRRIDALKTIYASPVGAGGRVYLTDREGTTVVLKQADQYEVLATNKLDEKFDASPAIAGNELFLRGHESLYCITAGAASPAP